MSMDYPVVNLLHKNEQRYQGIVSRRFMLVSLVVTPVLIFSILGTIQFVQRSWLKSNLETSREIWASLQPRLAYVQEESRALQTNQQVLDLFDGWVESKLAPVELMDDIQDLVPENIQITQLYIRGQSARSVYKTKEDLHPDYKLAVSGLADGVLAENAVIQLRKDFLTSQNVGTTFEEINLASMRKRNGINGTNVREFQLVGKSAAGGAK